MMSKKEWLLSILDDESNWSIIENRFSQINKGLRFMIGEMCVDSTIRFGDSLELSELIKRYKNGVMGELSSTPSVKDTVNRLYLVYKRDEKIDTLLKNKA